MSADRVVHALDGRSLGERGARTRQRLLEATAALLDARGPLDVRVVDVARSAKTSSATFYQYFRDVEDAVLVLAADAGRAASGLAAEIDASWLDHSGLERVRSLVARWFDYWDGHRSVLSVRNLLAQEGDERFRRARREANQPFMDALVSLAEASRSQRRVSAELSPIAAAAALMSLLERMAAFRVELEEISVDRETLVDATAIIVHQTVAGS